MIDQRPGSKGLGLEELLRAYFLRSGFFVVRAVPLAYDGEDLTDVDLLLYERPNGATRRVQIVDIKYKQRPKAAERMFWTRGLVEALDVDGGYVATTDSRKVLRRIADKLDLVVIDGTDLQRIRESPNVLFPDRISDEELIVILQSVDKGQRDRHLQDVRRETLASLSAGFGISSVVRSLEVFTHMADMAVEAHPGSDRALAAGRLCYLSAAITCASLDYVSVGAAFRSVEERKELLLNAVRFGAADSDEGTRSLRLAIGLIEKYAPGGRATANQVESGLKSDLKAIPAEIVADQAGRLLKEGLLFAVAREIEAASYQRLCPTFDHLSSNGKSMIGAFLDYAGVRREAFASAWANPEGAVSTTAEVGKQSADDRQDRTLKLFPS